ncbi:hypothetical protein LX15_000210 [Streptoalloteichus tenebrarius]|uniref:Uncharacterized protein n=1 Tax=Streptoalloteichus tenebrarius (strain ATCC 17920 / DSM 40477 / JCM 4838 / CBS 697.72 / NBRC 16177 / NCIMB 11028 / NRRL B-12390 / A12253. 1 / ISP 5477) TaxID=1933 RepID=A0ABT1HLX6_STRSD|nr:hypothetical protein [Streptoalloteichus tenebrarius]MCP2256527.1 hypothetical protein [Streptoalloteichus tenebrarius]BFF04880.1 hypothetical protein GCM10020241_65550 [Streptoalloteichus tenebrarius]
MRDEDILDAARAIRPRLSGALADEIDQLLARADGGEDVADALLEVLTGDDALRDEARRLLDRQVDTSRGADSGGYGMADSAGYAALPGYAVPSAEIMYGCGECDYEYPVFEVGEPVPHCPHGHGALGRVGGR